MEVGDGDGVKALLPQIGDYLLEVREIFAVDRERRIAVLVVDIEIEDISGNSFVAQQSRDLPDPGFRVVAVAALLVAQAPKGTQRRAADQGGVLFDDLFWLGTREEIIVQLATLGAKRIVIRRFLAEIKAAAVGVVEEN